MRLLWISNRVNRFSSRLNEKFTLPPRFKGTMVENWVLYWRNLIKDYKEVGRDIVKGAYSKPRRTLAVGIVGYSSYVAAKTNPSEDDFFEMLRYWNNQMIMVPVNLQNDKSREHLTQLELSINQNRLRFQSLGIMTILWEDKYDKDDCTYPAICKYTRLRFWDVPKHVLDIGFLGKFWRLNWQMWNFDVNYLN